MPLKPDSLQYSPPGGWNYIDPETGVKFFQTHTMALIQLVRKHRIANEHPIGAEWEARFWHQLCEQNPQAQCSDDQQTKRTYNADDVLSYLMAMESLARKGHVSDHEHNRRLALCAECPKRTVIPCGTCSALATMVATWLSGLKLFDKALYKQNCGACGCELTSKAAVHVDDLREIDQKLNRNPQYWEKCWMLENN
jgi:hypothetical protein